MRPILESLALYLVGSNESELGDTRIIVPNRRAGLFLQHHLSRHSPKVQWSPRIYAISDYINETSELDLSDSIETLFILYEIYQDIVKHPEPLDEFYFWGEIMLRDFDELDKYLVDAEMLFRNIIDLKSLEETMAGLESKQIEFIRQFWAGFHEGDQTPEKDQFLTIWKILPELYHRLRRELRSRGEGYQGMQYREIAERAGKGELNHSWKGRTIVAGFNALNSCEKKIFTWLKEHRADFFWDYDYDYTDDLSNEAGRFLRDNLVHFPARTKLEDFKGLSQEKQIRIFDLPTDVLQAKTVHRILEEEDHEVFRECTDTALVLCDEELLIPVIMSLPEHTGVINVTMGYPMKNTSVYSFIDALLRMQHNIRQSKGGVVSFYHKDVTSILLHPYLRNMEGVSGQSLLDKIVRSNLIQVDRQQFTGVLEKKIFRPLDSANNLIKYLRDIFSLILENIAEKEEQVHNALDREFIFQFLIHLNKLETLTAERPSLSVSILERLIRKQLSILRIPFEGEPLSGLQVMGILETRLLDFRRVILLSMNEEVMPAAQTPQSYIPYALRLAFAMPAREDMDAIYAYYFNRLLQRAEKIDLLFNSGSEGVRTGEMSRYLYQVMYNRRIEIIRPGLEVMARELKPIVVQHSAEAKRKLNKYTFNSEGERYLSPSAINTYIDCSLKYYLRYIAGIGEPDEVQEEIDAAGFGTVVHDTIKELYNDISDRNQGIIVPGELEKLNISKKPEEVLRKVFQEYHYRGKRNMSIEGRNIIIFSVMLRYLLKIIQTDLAIAPFTLVSAERAYGRNILIRVDNNDITIRMGGKIDRVDRVGDLFRVIDYKTGNARQTFSNLEALFDTSLNNRNAAAMQTLFYAWLVAEEHPDEEILPGLYVMKALYKDRFDPALIMGSHSERKRIDNFSDLEQHYIDLLKKVLVRLFDPGSPFVQRENGVKCSYCDFATICSRTTMD